MPPVLLKIKQSEPEIYQAQKGNQWHFGVDARTALTHSLSTTAANVHDFNDTANLLHGEKCFISADSGYRGAQKREELKHIKAGCLIVEMPSKIKAWSKHSRKNNLFEQNM